MKSTTLYFKQGSSDKVYRAAIEPCYGGHRVTFAYGRRGSTMTTGTKTNNPVSLAEAEKIFEKLITSKLAKGYTEGEDGTPYTAPATAERATGVVPQLLNPVGLEDPTCFIADDAWCMQPKHDGKRMLLQKRGSEITAINRRGLVCGLPQTIAQAASAFRTDFLIDGEAVGDLLYAFDILEIGNNLGRTPYRERLAELLNFLAGGQQRHIKMVETRFGSAGKRILFDRLVRERAEGVVFKRLDAPYTPGRPSVGGDQLKYKFVETASVIVTGVNAKRSVRIGLYDGDEIVSAGNVTIPADHEIPEKGTVAEVRYLYAMPQTNALFQPVYLGAREDIDASECVLAQLKYRCEEVAA